MNFMAMVARQKKFSKTKENSKETIEMESNEETEDCYEKIAEGEGKNELLI